MEIIPQQCLAFLPFKSEAVSSWPDDSDLLKFLWCLFDKSGTIIDEEGKEYQVNYADYGKDIYNEGRKQVRRISREFLAKAQGAKPAPAAENKVEPIPDFSNNEVFGLLAKYHVAWEGIVNEVLSESAFFSLEHTLESQTDLDCSILLASNLYYKQALQALRNFLEGIVVQLYFCDNQTAFADWKADSFNIPRFRGRDGMLENLRSRGILPDDLTRVASDLYGELNGSIHGAESRLIHQGTFSGEWAGLMFKYVRFQEWCQRFSHCVDFAIYAMRITVNMWENISASTKTGIRCSVCHSSDNFNIEKGDFGGRAHATVECLKCGNQMTFSAEWLASRGIG